MKREGEPLDYIVIDDEFYDIVVNLPTDEAGLMFKAVFNYFFGDGSTEDTIENATLYAVYVFIRNKVEEMTSNHRTLGHRHGYLVKDGKRNDPGYSAFRKTVLERDGYACRLCGSMDELHVHHIEPYAKCPELRVDTDNGITLCANCHRRIHHKMRFS